MTALFQLILAGLFALCLVGFSLVFKSDLISKKEAWKVFLGITLIAYLLILYGNNKA
jgi:hypothetical protein